MYSVVLMSTKSRHTRHRASANTAPRMPAGKVPPGGAEGKPPQFFLKAVELSVKAHGPQVRRNNGGPYIGHVFDVMNGVSGYSAKTVAVLHDVLEDTKTSVKDLRKIGVPTYLIDAVVALTKPPYAETSDKAYLEYVRETILPNKLACEVKLADLASNLRTADRAHRNKYLKAKSILEKARAAR